jgi:hypothetical protein
MYYHIAKLPQPSIAWLGSVLSSGLSTTPHFAIAAAYVCASTLSLPPQEVEDATAYYRLQHQSSVLDLLDTLNGLAPFDTQFARKVAFDFYSYRYGQTYAKAIPLAFRPDSGIEDFFGLTKSFGDEVLELIRKEPAKIVNVVDQLRQIVKAMKPEAWVPPTVTSPEQKLLAPSEI